MEARSSLIEPVLERISDYSKTSMELLKLQSLGKAADIGATIASRLVFAAAVWLVVVMVHMAAALFLGELLGRAYLGFLAVSAFDILAAVIVFLVHKPLKKKIVDAIIPVLIN